MQSASPVKPRIVKATMVCLGLLALFSVLACRSIPELLPEEAIVTTVLAGVANIAFIGALSETKLGRRVAIVILGLLAAGGAYGLVGSAQHFASQPVKSLAQLVLSTGLILWFMAYAFSKPARVYYSALWSVSKRAKDV